MRYARPMLKESNSFGRVPTFPNTSRRATQTKSPSGLEKLRKHCVSARISLLFSCNLYTIKLMSWSASPKPTRWIACSPGVTNWSHLAILKLKSKGYKAQTAHGITSQKVCWHCDTTKEGHMFTWQATQSKAPEPKARKYPLEPLFRAPLLSILMQRIFHKKLRMPR